MKNNLKQICPQCKKEKILTSDTGDKDLFLKKLCAWYKQAYLFSNTDKEIIHRNLAIISDAINSCHDPDIFKQASAPMVKRKDVEEIISQTRLDILTTREATHAIMKLLK